MYTRREETSHFHYISMPSTKTPCLAGHEIYNFVKPFLGLHYYILNLSDPYPSVYKKRRRKNDLCGHTLTQEPLPRGSWKFGRPFLNHHYYIVLLSLSESFARVVEKILKGIMRFYLMTYMATPWHKNLWPRGHEIYSFDRPCLGHHYFVLSLCEPWPE